MVTGATLGTEASRELGEQVAPQAMCVTEDSAPDANLAR
jgi:hypothetical protein